MTTPRQLLLDLAALETAQKNALLVKYLGPRGSQPNRVINGADTAALLEAFAAAATEQAVTVALEAVGDLADALEAVKQAWKSGLRIDWEGIEAALAHYRELVGGGTDG